MRNWNGSRGLGQLTPSDDKNGHEETGAEDNEDNNSHKNGQTVEEIESAFKGFDLGDKRPFDGHCQ